MTNPNIFPFDTEPQPAVSPTAHLLEELQTHGIRPFQDEPDPRPLPDDEDAQTAIAGALETLSDLFTDTRLEDDLADILWSCVNVFHRRVAALDRDLDGNEQAQRRSQREQDGSEVRSVELERLTGEGLGLIERRNAFEACREHAAAAFEALTGRPWRPRSGSRVNRQAMTAAVIDSRDFINARRRAETETLLPAGPRIAFAGGLDCNDHGAIWTALDKARARHPDMVLLHGGLPKGAERIAACWADKRGVAQVVFKPDWTAHGKAAPFRRNDRLLEAVPLGVIVFPGSGITDNLADKARRMGIPVWRCREGGA
ncbi:DUF2493 domain-containing protein [Roseospira visakhapatnamensis]|uniref:YspA cpYpsA-related SLOG domain-containing protein n=1 Tax=Roseospira visakhapatnamensis TaxID=390880 RepID=A0A7W6RG27_9PROT|nr:DUF2493 domain-containing protein [Roseospira visakhapatnamensis]MBB4267925.1 hypothetical protein [Roseospira visakhapatnamensis]